MPIFHRICTYKITIGTNITYSFRIIQGGNSYFVILTYEGYSMCNTIKLSLTDMLNEIWALSYYMTQSCRWLLKEKGDRYGRKSSTRKNMKI